MSYGFDRATAWYYDHIFSGPPDDRPGEPEPEDENEETDTEMEDMEE